MRKRGFKSSEIKEYVRVVSLTLYEHRIAMQYGRANRVPFAALEEESYNPYLDLEKAIKKNHKTIPRRTLVEMYEAALSQETQGDICRINQDMIDTPDPEGLRLEMKYAIESNLSYWMGNRDYNPARVLRKL